MIRFVFCPSMEINYVKKATLEPYVKLVIYMDKNGDNLTLISKNNINIT